MRTMHSKLEAGKTKTINVYCFCCYVAPDFPPFSLSIGSLSVCLGVKHFIFFFLLLRFFHCGGGCITSGRSKVDLKDKIKEKKKKP
jgi:hypothetical protein